MPDEKDFDVTAEQCRKTADSFSDQPKRDKARARKTLIIATCLFVASAGLSAETDRQKPSLFLIGDFTVRNCPRGQLGWRDLFADEHTHTNPKGAKLNAQCVVQGLRALRVCPLTKHLAPEKSR